MIRTARLRAVVCSLALVIGLGLWWLERSVGLSFFSPERIQTLGWPAVWMYGALMVLLGGVGVPPVVMILPATAVWSFQVSFPLAFAGGFGASWLGFLLSRHFFRQTVSARIPERIATYEHRLETHGFSTVLVMRLLFYLFPPINWMLGISAISQRDFLLATAIGMLPWTLAYVGTGRGLMVVVDWLTPGQLVAAAVIVMGILISWWRWAVRE